MAAAGGTLIFLVFNVCVKSCSRGGGLLVSPVRSGPGPHVRADPRAISTSAPALDAAPAPQTEGPTDAGHPAVLWEHVAFRGVEGGPTAL